MDDLPVFITLRETRGVRAAEYAKIYCESLSLVISLESADDLNEDLQTVLAILG